MKRIVQQWTTVVPGVGRRRIRGKTRLFSGMRGQDLLADAALGGEKPKIILDAYSETGVDVTNVIEKVDDTEEAQSGSLHMVGSVMAFPHACFLWNVQSASEVTVESLLPAVAHRPKLQYLFLGSDVPIDQKIVREIKDELRTRGGGIVFEHLDVVRNPKCCCCLFVVCYQSSSVVVVSTEKIFFYPMLGQHNRNF